MRRAVAGIIVCFKPQVFLTLCILLVIAHSLVLTLQKGAEVTTTITCLILIVVLVWGVTFIFIVRFELRNELETLLNLFQCSKRGLRFLGVVAFHVAFLALVAMLVSSAVNNIQRSKNETEHELVTLVQLKEGHTRYAIKSDDSKMRRARRDENIVRWSAEENHYLLFVYKIWLTAIVYAFLYVIIENLTMLYTDLTLVESVHDAFVNVVAKTTGIDLSDYPAGEMLFNPLVRRRVR